MAAYGEATVENMPSVASFGFWANKNIPLSAGVRKVTLPISESSPQVVDSQVKSMCHVAQELADAGTDIRWDVVLAQAAELPCGIRSLDAAKPETTTKKPLSDSEDCESTSAGSGTVSDVAAANDTDTTKSSEEEFPMLGSIGREKLKKKRGVGLPSSKANLNASKNHGDVSNSRVASDAAPIEKEPHGSTSALVYTLPFLLHVFEVMRQADAAASNSSVSSPPARQGLSTASTSVFAKDTAGGASDGVDASKGASNQETSTTAKKNAPWRRSKAAAVA